MLLSIVVYTFLALTLFLLGWHVSQREARLKTSDGKTLTFWSWEIVLSIVIFAIVAGARYHTGYDHSMYLHQYVSFQKYGFFTRDFEPLFMWVTQLMAIAHIHFCFYFALWALLQAGFLAYACRHEKALLPWMWLSLVLGSFFIYLMNTVREGLVASIFIAAVPLILRRQFLQYAVVALLASTIHKSGLMMFPFFVLGVIRVSDKEKSRWLLFTLFACALLIGIRPYWLSWLLKATDHFNVVSPQYRHLIEPLMAGQFNLHNWGATRISMLIINVMVIWFYPKMRHFFKNDEVLPVFFVLFWAYCIVYYLLINVHHLFFRPFDCLMMCRLMMYSYLGMFLYRSRRWAMMMAYALLNFSYIYIALARAEITADQVHQQVFYHLFFV